MSQLCKVFVVFKDTYILLTGLLVPPVNLGTNLQYLLLVLAVADPVKQPFRRRSFFRVLIGSSSLMMVVIGVREA